MGYFRDIDCSAIRDMVAFVDVDGTLVPDGRSEIGKAELAKLRELAAVSTVILVSNKGMGERDEAIAAASGAKRAATGYRKPDLRAAGETPSGPSVVIGDKFFTDGLFARNIGAGFIKVARLTDGAESLAVRLSNVIDNAFWRVYHSFKR